MRQIAAANQTWKFPGLEQSLKFLGLKFSGITQLATEYQTWKFPGLEFQALRNLQQSTKPGNFQVWTLASMVQLAAANQTWKFPGLDFGKHGTTGSSQPNLEISRFAICQVNYNFQQPSKPGNFQVWS